MKQEPNPYQSPIDESCRPSQNGLCPASHHGFALAEEFGQRIIGARWAILGVALVFGLVAALSFCMFVYQTLSPLPSGEPLAVSNLFWLLAHLVRGMGLAIVAWQLWRYAASLKGIRKGNDGAVGQFLDCHTSLWVWGALVLFLICGHAVFSTIWVMISALGSTW